MSGPAGEHFFSEVIDGSALRGVWHEPSKRKARAILVISHGLNGERVDTHRLLVTAARTWSQAGFVTWRFDHRGCGLSDGEFFTSLPTFRAQDLQAVVSRARLQHPKLPVVLLGFSDGCRSALLAADEVNPDAVVLWSPILQAAQASGEPCAIPPWQRHPYQSRAFVRPFLGHWLGHAYIRETQAWNAPRVRPPILVLSGSEDADVVASIETLLTAELVSRQVVVRAAGHLYASPEASAYLIRTTQAWLTDLMASQEPA
ncbi:alpha/beta hydrolase [Deinococcus sp. QL22]|uniref:alpha/beta hydrolase n=1 Tax=Deinococcus sp. QL22 TaxID=2939437 RepID=UPI002016C9B9|nr:alpha/beta fold hydrolase [Deinococcus sp. QL22]UQN07953.1 alpha/beta fold hydrolase [Deinococcus sp. QL22]